MRGAVVVEIGSGDAAGCARRLLLAFQSKSLQQIDRELTRAARICERPAISGMRDSLTAERNDLLAAIVDSVRASIAGHRPCGEVEVSLLGHLAA